MSGIIGGAGSKSGVIGETEIDYEEGIYNVVFTAASGTSNTDTARHALAYTKIGNRVTVSGYGRIGSPWSGTGNLTINLPLLSAPHTGSYTGYTYGLCFPEALRQAANTRDGLTTPYYNANDFALTIGPSTSTANIVVTGGAGYAGTTADAGPQYTAATQMVVNTNFQFNFTYQTTL